MGKVTLKTVLVIVLVFLLNVTVNGEPDKRRGTQLFFRMTGSQNNTPILPKTRSVWTQDKLCEVGNTGMANEGYTEYPFCFGLMDFTFVERYSIYPRFVSGAQADENIVNTADMVIDHVYQPDGCVWGFSGREFVQTFTATGDELVSITLLVASEPATFRAALIEGGAEGKQIGPTRTFYSGHSMEWGTARWTAGQTKLVGGRTYGIKMWREDGENWMPYLHSLGNAYDGGLLYVDGKARIGTDMAIWIVEEPKDLKRGLVVGADEEGWVYNKDSVRFIPRTPNIKMIWLNVSPITMDPPTAHNCCDLVIRVWDQKGKLVAGPKRSLACGPKNGPHPAPFIFASDEFPVTVGQVYRINAYAVPHKAPLPKNEDIRLIQPADFNLRVYGEPQPGGLPAIYNLKVDFPEDNTLKLSWSDTFAAPARIIIQGDGMKGAGNKTKHVDLEKNTTEALINIWPGHTYEFKIISTGPTGLVWRTPVYQVRAPRKDEIKAIFQAAAPNPKQFINLAPPGIAIGAEAEPIRFKMSVKVANNDFEEGMKGWKATPSGILNAHDVGWTSKSVAKRHGISTKWGDKIAGLTHIAGRKREQVFEKSTLTQKISTTRGNVYLLAAMVRTHIKNGPITDKRLRGDVRVRLFADPKGGMDYEGINTTQSYWTDNKWMRFKHRWIAEEDKSTIGLGFFRWRDLDFAGSYVDHVHVYDLGPSPAVAEAPQARSKKAYSVILTDLQVESDDKVEAYLKAPPGYVITGLGSRAHYDNITTMWLKVQPILPDGTLGEAEELRHGWEPDAHLEAKVELPAGYVATGFGAGIAPEWDVKRLGVWARPLAKDGTLGEEKLFRGGIDLKSGFEKTVRLEKGRALTSAGLNCMVNDVNGIKATSAKLTKTAEAQSKSK
ncbi:MAG: hypothetical protein ACYSU3_02795 [Planctomycetota bacterium]|jgi:hypothetical protein